MAETSDASGISRRRRWAALFLLIPAMAGCRPESSAVATDAAGFEVRNPPLSPVRQPQREISARMEDEWVLGKSAEGTFEPARESVVHAAHRPSMEGPEGVGPLLGRPIVVRSGSQERVYVADKASLQVKVYNREGNVLGVYGGRGREPGQFMTLSAMHVARGSDQSDRVLVADGISSRLTAFAPDGSVESTAETELREMLWPRYLQHLSTGELVFLYKMPPRMRDGAERPDAAFLFHLYSEDLVTKLGAFGPVEDFGPVERPIEDAFSQVRPGHFWVTQDDAILFAPSLYRGRVYRYRRGADGRWNRDQVLQGFLAQGPPLLEVSPTDEQQHLHFKITRGGVAMAARIRNESRGVFELSDGRMVHFSLQTVASEGNSERASEEGADEAGDHGHHSSGDRDQVTFGVELFSPEGDFLGYGAVDTFTEHGHTEQFYVDWKDDQDRFYIREMTDRFVVWVVNLEVDEESDRG